MERSILRLEPSISFSTVSRDAWSAPQHNANEFICGGRALEVPKRSPGGDIAQPNAEPVSGKFHAINFMGEWWSDEGQTFSCFAVCLSSPFVTVINCKVPPWILLRTMGFGGSGAFAVARVWSSSPFHLACAADGSQLIFAHLIWEENKAREALRESPRQRHEAQRPDPGVDARTHTRLMQREKKFESIRNSVCFAKGCRWGSFYSHNFNSWIKSNHICSTHYTLRPFFTVCSLCDVLRGMGIFYMQICGKTASFFFLPVQFLLGIPAPCFFFPNWLSI